MRYNDVIPNSHCHWLSPLVIGILCLADKYNVDALRHLCQNYMIDHCKSPRTENIQNALIW